MLQGERSTVTGLRDEGGGLLGEIERALEDCFAGGSVSHFHRCRPGELLIRCEGVENAYLKRA